MDSLLESKNRVSGEKRQNLRLLAFCGIARAYNVLGLYKQHVYLNRYKRRATGRGGLPQNWHRLLEGCRQSAVQSMSLAKHNSHRKCNLPESS